MGISLGRAPLGGSETEATTGWTDAKPWEIAWGELGRAPLGGSDILRSRAAGMGFQDKFHQCDCPARLRAQDFSSRLKTLGGGACTASLAGSDTKNAQPLARVFSGKKHQYDCSEKLRAQDLPKFPNPGYGTCIASLAGSETKRAELLAGIFQDKFHQHDCPEKLVPKTSQTVSKRWTKGHAGHAWKKVLCWRGFHFARRSVRRCLVFAPFAAKQTMH